MKHKLTVLACVGLALLLSTGLAFAQNTITIESKGVDRCATFDVAIYLDNVDAVDAIGLAVAITGPGSIVGVAPAARLAGHSTATNQSGSNLLLNAAGNCLAAGSGAIWTLTVTSDADCSGDIVIDVAPFPGIPTAGTILTDCSSCELPVTVTAGVLSLVNNAPTCGINNDVTLHFSSEIVDKQLNASDADVCDALTYTLISGPGTIVGDKYSWNPDCPDVATSPHTVTFEVDDGCTGTVQCSFDVTVTQNAPVCEAVGPQSVHWTDHLSVALPATDDNCPNPLTWTLDDNGGLTGALSVAGGTLEYDGTCADIAGSPHTVVYTVSDGVLSCQSSVDITVTNDAPTIVCPTPDDGAILCNRQWIADDGIFNVGDLVSGSAIGDDVNGDPVTYSIISMTLDGNPYTPVNAPVIDGLGNFSWQSDGSDGVGTYEFCLEISDGCYSNTCCFTIDMEAVFYVGIRDASGTVDTIPALPGTEACAYVSINPNIPLGGLDLLLNYDPSVMSVTSVGVLGDLADWEYWTYRMSANSNCTGGCPSGLVRVVAIADMDNGPAIHPPDDSFGLENNVIEICFLVTSDWNYLGQCLPIGFTILECGDNTLASKDGNTTYMAYGQSAICDNSKPGHSTIDQIELCGGWICLREPLDDRGDINLNGIANEVGDAVLFTNYFIEGPSVWTSPWEAVQEQASDVNNDGVTLTIADLVYLIRVITGDAMPFPNDNGNPKVSPYAGEANAVVDVNNNQITISTNSSVDLGGAVFVFRYTDMGVGAAELTDASSQMFVRSRADRGELRVLVAPQMDVRGAHIASGLNDIVTIPVSGNGSIELVEVQISDADGGLLTSSVAKVAPPTSYALLQNYPNPFNAGTVISFDLKNASEWNLSVYNVTGQLVRSFSGEAEASRVQITWDGTDANGNVAASGVYFYRVTANDFTSTKKMTLLK